MELRPIVKFVFLTELRGRDFEEYFRLLLADFYDSVSDKPSNKHCSMALREHYDHYRFNGDEGGVGRFFIGDVFIPHCKAHFLNGVDRGEFSHYEELFCGVIFRNHPEPPRLKKEVFMVADAFDRFLQEKVVPFERYNFSGQTGYFLVPVTSTTS